MKSHVCTSMFLLTLLALTTPESEAKACKPSGVIRGKKPPPGSCDPGGADYCCEKGKSYKTFKCSPNVSGHTKAILTLNSFERGGDGGGPAECDGKYHSNEKPVVALSTGWFNNMQRCFHKIVIHGNGNSVEATVVDECDSSAGCDEEHGYQLPCRNNIVDGSKAVWEALGVPSSDWGELEIHWSEA